MRSVKNYERDFELSIINGCKTVYPTVPISCCLFHLEQSLYKRVQEEGLQGRYNDPDDRTLKEYTHMIMSLTFVPLADIPTTFEQLKDAYPPPPLNSCL